MASVDPRLKAWFLRLYEIPFLAVVVAFAWQVRIQSLAPLVTKDHVYYVGTDPYYHLRVILATVANFPDSLRYDPFTHFPNGTGTGQFGSLFDQGAAALALLLGKTDRLGVAEVAAWYPALLGALIFVPFYFLARRLVGRIGAAFATIALSLLPGEFLVRSLAGYTDHHIAEALGMVLALLGVVVSLDAAARRGASLRSLRDWRALAWPLGAVALGALGIVAYFLVWPPAILVVGIFGIALSLTLAYDHARGADTTYIAFGGGGPFLLAGLLLLPTAESTQMNFNTFSLLQPVACLLLGALLVGLHFASEALRAKRAHPAVLPTSGAAFGLLGFWSLQYLAPGLYGSLKWGASWVTGIGVKREILTIAEAQPSSWVQLEGEYALLLPVFLLALVAMVVVVLVRRRRGDLLLLVWSLLMWQAARTQVRFNYYLALTVAMAFGWLAWLVADLTGLNRALAAWFGRADSDAAVVAPASKASRGRKTRVAATKEATPRAWQFLAVGAVALVLVPSLVLPEVGANGERATNCNVRASIYPVWVLGKCFGGPDQNLRLWVEELDWMRAGTAPVGLDIHSLQERPPPGEPFAYPEGAYGVLSWWDYGHWIEVEGERPPVANPFQQAAPFASCFFTATTEARAEALLRAWSAQKFTRGADNAACEKAEVPAIEGDSGKPVRYVMIDDEMAAGKFYAITVWAKYNGYARENDKREFTDPDSGERLTLNYVGRGYYDTMLARLYVDDARDLRHYRLVHETKTTSVIGSVVETSEGRGQITRFNDLINRQVREPQQIGSFGRDELLPTGGAGEYAYDAKIASSVKTFERVAGANLTGVATPGASVRVSVPLKSDTNGRTFTWESSTKAGDDGAFSIVVPYATTGYVGPAEGGTDYSVRATGPAVLRAGDGSAAATARVDVPDRAVLDGATLPVSFA